MTDKLRSALESIDKQCDFRDRIDAFFLLGGIQETAREALASAPAGEEPIKLIDARIADLKEANRQYQKSPRFEEDKIQRNDREISWLKDLRSEILLAPQCPVHTDSLLTERAADFIEKHDPFGDHFSQHDLLQLRGLPTSRIAEASPEDEG